VERAQTLILFGLQQLLLELQVFMQAELAVFSRQLKP
jgi:hypothetical protein